jgi:two-component system, cell cycle response regulator
MPDKLGETCIIRPLQLRAGNLDACLVHIYPTGPCMGRRYPLGTETVVLGRGETTNVRIQDGSVSRRHAKIEPSVEGYSVQDLQSTNGTFVNDRPIQTPRLLQDGDYVRVGNCIYRYLTGGNIEAEYHEEIYRLTIIDGLTQIHNQRYLLDFLERELARSRRHRRPLSVLMMDIDHFKAVNDEHGHLCGDFVLREMSSRLRHTVRREDLFARYGGEEFCLVLVEASRDPAIDVAERVRIAVESAPFRFDKSVLNMTVSIGVAVTDGECDLTPAEILHHADEKLYAAKRAGRNQVVG